MHPLIVIVGPTASGKSDLALSLAEHFNGEIVNYDSIQIFRGFDIGSAKPPVEDRRRMPHHMIDVREPADLFTAGDYQREARNVLEEVRLRGRIPVLVGGTGLYLRALTEGLFAGPTRSEHLRERFGVIVEQRGVEYLHRILRRLDPAAAGRIASRDKPKIIRALEVRLETGKPLTEHLQVEPRRPLQGFTICTVGLNPAREECFRRIDARVERMFDDGLVDEVKGLLARGVPRSVKPFGALGYRHVLANLDNTRSWEDTIRVIQRDTRRYAKRQWTWFRRQTNTTWFDGPGNNKSIQEEVHRRVQLLAGEFYGV
jgi:tRNA dimethylallyltransferase